MTWERATVDTYCGLCGMKLVRGQPVALVSQARKPRCEGADAMKWLGIGAQR